MDVDKLYRSQLKRIAVQLRQLLAERDAIDAALGGRPVDRFDVIAAQIRSEAE